MGPAIIARNYAETLLSLAQQQGGDEAVESYARAIDQVAEMLRDAPRVREFLETPRISAQQKKDAIRAAFADRVPAYFLRFLLVVVENRRQALFPLIADEYHLLVDRLRGRTRAEITVARPPTPETQREVIATLERQLGLTVDPTFRVDPAILGGVVVRVGDQLLDGSVRRRLASLRRRLVEARLPETPVVNS